MKLKPLPGRIIVKQGSKLQPMNLIVLTDQLAELQDFGTVVALGEKAGLDLRVGDVVLFGSYSGNKIRVDSEEYLYLEPTDVIGVRT